MLTLPIGTYVGQYEIVDSIAQTFASHVYLVHCKILNAHLALKVCADENAESATSKRFVKQAGLMHAFAGVEHIANVMHVGTAKVSLPNTNTTSSLHYIVMPYFKVNLAQSLALNGQVLAPDKSVDVMQQLFKALHSLHIKGVLHNDIKPQNVLLDEHERLSLTDFDNASVFPTSSLYESHGNSQEKAQQFGLGIKATAEYASPELILAAKNVADYALLTHCSDLYSAGALWFRVLHGEPYRGQGQHYIANSLLHKAPNWLVQLLMQLLNHVPNDRPKSAAQCLARIQRFASDAENYETEMLQTTQLQSKAATLMQQGIEETLLHWGEISQENRVKLMLSYQQALLAEQANTLSLQQEQSENAGIDSEKLNDEVSLLIHQSKQLLINTQNLSLWFTWVEGLNTLRAEKGRIITSEEYRHLLQAGNQARPDASTVIETVLAAKFTTLKWSFVRTKKALLPIVIIASVFVFWYLNKTLNPKASNQMAEVKPSVFKQNSQNSQTSTPQADTPLVEAPLSNQDKSIPLLETQPKHTKSLYELLASDGIATIQIRSTAPTMQSAQFELVTLSTDSTFAVMRTEVTNQLFQLCINDGACRKRKHFATGSKNGLIDKPSHPKVNVSWFDVTEDFVPWINEKTAYQFALPSFIQWQSFSDISTSHQLHNVHCKNCDNALSRQYAGSTIDVHAMATNSHNLFAVHGNVQEWLGDCWRENNIERCDQAMVVGGSWIDKQAKVKQNTPSQLLKRATTPTTGFRLILELDD